MNTRTDKDRIRDALAQLESDIEASDAVLDYEYVVHNDIDQEGDAERTLVLKVRVGVLGYGYSDGL